MTRSRSPRRQAGAVTARAAHDRRADLDDGDVFGAGRRRAVAWAGGLAVLLVASLVAVGVGSVNISPGTTVRILAHSWPAVPAR